MAFKELIYSEEISITGIPGVAASMASKLWLLQMARQLLQIPDRGLWPAILPCLLFFRYRLLYVLRSVSFVDFFSFKIEIEFVLVIKQAK